MSEMSKLHKQKQKDRRPQPPTSPPASAASAAVAPAAYDEAAEIDELEALNELERLDDLLEAEAGAADAEVTDEPMVESTSSHTDRAVQASPTQVEPPLSNDHPLDARPDAASLVTAVTVSTALAHQIAKEAVEKVLVDQAEARLFDVFNNRLTITLPDDDLTALESQWREQNSKVDGDASAKLPFSTFVANRLRGCRSHNASRAIYVSDSIRQHLESLFGDVIYSESDLKNKIDRHLRPIIESPDNPTGIMRLKPLDPLIVEIVPGWYPDKSPSEAISDFINDAVREKAGLA